MKALSLTTTASSPRAWGCFSGKEGIGNEPVVFPTCVGVFHARWYTETQKDVSSPRAWGCFSGHGASWATSIVFPTCVGVFPSPVSPESAERRSSPRAWGCFHEGRLLSDPLTVFPTCVGVFPVLGGPVGAITGLPHVRGGVSEKREQKPPKRRSSPRAWGCFDMSIRYVQYARVFPTCVGVFLLLRSQFRYLCSLPHVRGGVSSDGLFGLYRLPSSPRAWGCFQGLRPLQCISSVFPTCVGVFLSASR